MISRLLSPDTERPRSRRSLPVGLFVAWTLFVWVGRLRNIVAELAGPNGLDDPSVGTFSLVASVVFTLLGVAVAGAWAGNRLHLFRPVVLGLVGLTIAVWLVRGVDIAAGDHSAGFIAVHTGLAVVSIAIAALVWHRRPEWADRSD